MAEREGFEPSIELPRYGISSAAPSTRLGDLSAVGATARSERFRSLPAAPGPYADTSLPSCPHRVWNEPDRSSRRYV
jgi:hypothetical protein